MGAKKILDEREAAEMLGVSHRTLQGWRRRKVGPPFVKVASHVIRYRQTDVAAFIERKLVATELVEA